MQLPAQRILIIGGGFSGMSAAIQLAKSNHRIDLVEIDAGWRSYGAGISISGPSLRAMGTLGILNEFQQQGWCADGCDMLTASGHLMLTIPTPRVAGDDVPGGAGIMRPVLAKILADKTRAMGVNVRLGCTFSKLDMQDDVVIVNFTDGTQGSYDLVIGADGVFSRTRDVVFPHAPKPRYTGQGVWRAVLPRTIERASMYMGEHAKAGFNPVSKDEMYLFVTENRPSNEHVPDDQLVPQLRALLAEFTAPEIVQVRDGLGATSRIVYRPLEGMLLPQPWHRGRVLLIGDAVHATTPHLASGAGIGIEDGIVIADELSRAGSVAEALQRFGQRRWERCRLVVENSFRLGVIEIEHGSKQEHAELMRVSMAALLQPV